MFLSWLNFHPDHTPEDIARVLRAEDDVDEIASAVRTSQRPGSSSRRPGTEVPRRARTPLAVARKGIEGEAAQAQERG